MQTHENVEVPSFLGADAAYYYIGKDVTAIGLMCGDLLCIRAVENAHDGRLVIAQHGDEKTLGIFRHLSSGVVAIQPLDSACPARIFAEGKDDPPHVVGEVTGWVHSILPAESIQEGGAGL